MRLAYPADLTEEPEGGFTVTFPDVPEAITYGRDREEALREAELALVSALSFYADEGQPFTRRSPSAGRPLLVHASSLAWACVEDVKKAIGQRDFGQLRTHGATGRHWSLEWLRYSP
jgi:antitoxin HicB